MRKGNCITLHYENLEDVDRLPDSYAGELFKGIIHYSKTGIQPIFSNSAIVDIFKAIANSMDEEKKTYEAKCDKYRQNAMKRYTKANTVDIGFDHLWVLYGISESNRDIAETLWNEMPEAERIAAIEFVPVFTEEHPVQQRMYLNKFLKKKPWQNNSSAMAKK